MQEVKHMPPRMAAWQARRLAPPPMCPDMALMEQSESVLECRVCLLVIVFYVQVFYLG